jgi:hypothetical protein
MQANVERHLHAIVGKRLLRSDRAADMEMLAFGEPRKVRTFKGDIKEVGEYSLHIQCPWRIMGPAGIVVGSHDVHYVSEASPHERASNSEEARDQIDHTLRDERMNSLLGASPLFVESVQADSAGGFRLALTGGYTLEVFPDASPGGRLEMWRLLSPGTEREHFVMLSNSFELE